MNRPPSPAQSVVLFGCVERILFYNEESGFTIAKIREKRTKELVTVTGVIPFILEGNDLRLRGSWTVHLLYGKQLEVQECSLSTPKEPEGIIRYLSSSLFKGIGPLMARRIFDKFGLESLEIVESEPHRLLEVAGFGRKRLEKIVSCWEELAHLRDLVLFLQPHGATLHLCTLIYKRWGGESQKKIEANPYLLADEVRGIGFRSADQIAKRMGFLHDSKERIDSGLLYQLNETVAQGHSCYPEELLLTEGAALLEVHLDSVKERLEQLIQEEKVIRSPIVEGHCEIAFIWKRTLYGCEVGILKELSRLKANPSPLPSFSTERALVWAESKLNLQFADQQKEAILQALRQPMLILTGGPGTGKTTITRAIVSLFLQLNKTVQLAAPTGKAAKRLSELTGRPAMTIHLLLEYSFKERGFRRNRDRPLECDLLIVDEASMIDTYLFFQLLSALPSGARLILVGDIHQLPSVGPGNVLRDLIISRTIETVQLLTIFRQAAHSMIVVNAHRILTGTLPHMEKKEGSDYLFLEEERGEAVVEILLDLMTKKLPKMGFNLKEQVQILSPMRRGILGIDALNEKLQAAINPKDGNGLVHRNVRYRAGDRIMQLRNNYQKELFNGTIGLIERVDVEDGSLLALFEGKSVVIKANELDEISLAYAVSIHKFQGSEIECVVIPFHSSHAHMLERKLLYTAITRGKKLCVVIGDVRALEIAVLTDCRKQRYSGLKAMLTDRYGRG